MALGKPGLSSLDDDMPSSLKHWLKWGGGTVGLILLFFIFAPYFTVNQNEAAVVTNWGKFDHVDGPGLHIKIPIVNEITYFKTDLQTLTPSQRINTYTIDNQEVDVLFTVFYRVPMDQVPYIYSSNRDYAPKLLSMTIDRMKAAMGGVNVQSVAEKRGELRDAVKATLANDAKALGLEITDFQLTDLQYTDQFRQAVNNAAVQKANIESVEYQRQQQKLLAETAQIKALGEANAAREAAHGQADARVFQATAEAKAIQLQGEAQGAAIKAQTDALQANKSLVEYEKAKRWNGELPKTMMSGVMPFMSVDQAVSDSSVPKSNKIVGQVQ